MDECRRPFFLVFLSLTVSLFSDWSHVSGSGTGRAPNMVEVEYRRIDLNIPLELRRLKNSDAELFLLVFSIFNNILDFLNQSGSISEALFTSSTCNT